jgi:hypothetical protein
MEHMFYLSDLTREGRFLAAEESIFPGFYIIYFKYLGRVVVKTLVSV